MNDKQEQPKPTSAIKKAVMRSRHSATVAKRAQGIVVAASMAVTMMGWVLFSQHDAEMLAAQSAQPDAVVAATQQTDSSTPTPMITTIETAGQTAGQGTPTAVSVGAQVFSPR